MSRVNGKLIRVRSVSVGGIVAVVLYRVVRGSESSWSYVVESSLEDDGAYCRLESLEGWSVSCP